MSLFSFFLSPLCVKLIGPCRISALYLASENPFYHLSRNLILSLLNILPWFWCDYHYPNHYYYPSLGFWSTWANHLKAGSFKIAFTTFIFIFWYNKYQVPRLCALCKLKCSGALLNSWLISWGWLGSLKPPWQRRKGLLKFTKNT